jgi:molybdate transport system ATP-binding protein
LRAIAGLERVRGLVRVGDATWQDDDRRVFVPTHWRAIGYVFQDPSLFPHLTVRGNLDYGHKRSRTPVTSDQARSIVELLGIGHLLERRPVHLSGGERQRVAIARALLAGPNLLLMDEPLASLDVERKAEILPYLERLGDGSSTPVLYVSHALEEVSRLADQVVLLDGGRVRACGPTSETLARLDLPTALFDDAGVVLAAQVMEHDEIDQLTRLDIGGASLWVGRTNRPTDARARVRILARDVSLARDPPGLSSILNVLAGQIEELRDDGPHRVNVRLSVGASHLPLLARITRRSREALGLSPGLAVHALVKSVALIA